MKIERLYHPNIEGGRRVIEVPESSVSTHLRSGWLRCDPTDRREEMIRTLVDSGYSREEAEAAVRPPDPDPEETTEAPADAGASALRTTRRGGGASSKGDE